MTHAPVPRRRHRPLRHAADARRAKGACIAKVGAEGVHSVALVDEGIGIAVKVEDGAPRAQYPAVLRLPAGVGRAASRLPEPLAASRAAADPQHAQRGGRTQFRTRA